MWKLQTNMKFTQHVFASGTLHVGFREVPGLNYLFNGNTSTAEFDGKVKV